jgi:hypothetical protein
MRWDEEWTKAQDWGCPCHPKKYPRSTSVKAWGCPRHSLLHQQKCQVIFQDTIFLLLHMLCVVLGASLFFLSVFFCFVCCNKWLDPNMFLLEKTHLIHLKYIYNFLMLHACLCTICFVFCYTSWHFYAFSRTNQLTRCHSASSMFSAVFVFHKSYTGNILGIGRNKSRSSYFSWHKTESKAETEGS